MFVVYDVDRVLFGFMLKERPGRVTTYISEPMVKPGDKVLVTWFSDKGQYDAEPHSVVDSGPQQIPIPDEKVLMHLGTTVYVSYTVSHADGTESNSDTFTFVVGSGKPDLDQLPEVEILEARDGLLKLADVPNGATFRIPSIPGLHRGMYLILRVYYPTGGIPCGPDVPPPCGEGIEYVLRTKQIRTTADTHLSFRLEPDILRPLIGKKLRAGYAIVFYHGFWYNRGTLEEFRIEE